MLTWRGHLQTTIQHMTCEKAGGSWPDEAIYNPLYNTWHVRRQAAANLTRLWPSRLRHVSRLAMQTAADLTRLWPSRIRYVSRLAMQAATHLTRLWPSRLRYVSRIAMQAASASNSTAPFDPPKAPVERCCSPGDTRTPTCGGPATRCRQRSTARTNEKIHILF